MPEYLESLKFGVCKRAFEKGLVKVSSFNPRDYAPKPYRQVDDTPYGGGPGMVMMYEPLAKAITQAKKEIAGCKTVYLSPQGRHVTQKDIDEVVKNSTPIIFVAGRYEGIDERVLDNFIDEEWSLGDFVLSGGELAAMVFIDAIVRRLPGCLGSNASAENDSFINGILDYPHYTRPQEVAGMRVPKVLLSGDHKNIEKWRRQQALGKTWLKRPDLLENLELNEFDQKLLNEFKTNLQNEGNTSFNLRSSDE